MKASARSEAEELLAVQLAQAGIPFTREFTFAPEEWCRSAGFLTPTGLPRKWRADFHIYGGLLVEIEGGGFVAGRHSRGAGMYHDAEKYSAAAILEYRVIRAVPEQVRNGSALRWIRLALGPR